MLLKWLKKFFGKPTSVVQSETIVSRPIVSSNQVNYFPTTQVSRVPKMSWTEFVRNNQRVDSYLNARYNKIVA